MSTIDKLVLRNDAASVIIVIIIIISMDLIIISMDLAKHRGFTN